MYLPTLHNKTQRHPIKDYQWMLFLMFTMVSLFSSATQAQNEGRWYQVEILIFKQADARYNEEIWRKDTTLEYPSDSIYLGNTLSNKSHQLGGHSYSLKKSDGYRVLFHKAWIQQMWGRQRSPSIIIRGGETFDDHRELEGTLKIHIGRLLHVTTDLWLSDYNEIISNDIISNEIIIDSSNTELFAEASVNNINPPEELSVEKITWPKIPSLPDTRSDDSFFIDENQINGEEKQSPRVITLRQTRSMRSKETHYIDHPVMGVLVHMLPVNPP